MTAMTTKEKVKEIDRLRKAGSKVEEACEQVGLSSPSYYIHKKNHAKPARKTKAIRIHLPDITEELPFSGGKIFALVGAPREVMEAIRSVL